VAEVQWGGPQALTMGNLAGHAMFHSVKNVPRCVCSPTFALPSTLPLLRITFLRTTLICFFLAVSWELKAQVPRDELARLVAELRSELFEQREAATRSLVAFGPAAIEPLVKAAEGANLELALRSIHVLHSMCLSSDDATWQAAEEALRMMANGTAEVASRCAQDILSTMPSSALARLRSMGAHITDGASITIGETWRGKDDGLVNLRWMPRLTTLWIAGAPVTDIGLQHLRWVPRLRDLAIRKVPITDVGLQELKWVPLLQNLYLNDTQITDAGLKELAGRTSLKALELESERITDASLDVLRGLSSLKLLSVRKTKISAEGVARLRVDLKNTRVKTDEDIE
jgi:hypothetical protein